MFSLRKAVEQEIGRQLKDNELAEAESIVLSWPQDNGLITYMDEMIQEETDGKLSVGESGALSGRISAMLMLMFILGRSSTLSGEEAEARLEQEIEVLMRDDKANNRRNERMTQAWPEIAERVYG